MSESDQQLADEIASTLKGIIHVPRPHEGSFVARPDFWRRCRLLNPNWRLYRPNRVFVDGFVGACHWNSWKVYCDALEDELGIWMGYAFGWGWWSEHAWCMRGDLIIETTAPFVIYYGAALTPDECEFFGRRYGKFDLASRQNLQIYTFVDGGRQQVAYDPAVYGQSIGRERDSVTGRIKDGLGRASDSAA